jgi:hypothetical protein
MTRWRKSVRNEPLPTLELKSFVFYLQKFTSLFILFQTVSKGVTRGVGIGGRKTIE